MIEATEAALAEDRRICWNEVERAKIKATIAKLANAWLATIAA
jgi:hypothetical protein